MALKEDSSCIDEKSLGIKVEGELNDFQIIEEISDSEEYAEAEKKVVKSSRTVDTLSIIPSNLVKPASSPSVCGNVAVTNSENVVIGNHTYFNGPVTIKQVIQSAPGLDNPSYVKSESEDGPSPIYHEESKHISGNQCYKTFRYNWFG